MPTTTTLTLFAASALLLMVIPGPAVFYVLARSASQGTRAGLVSVAGLHTGTLVHVAAAVLGLSAILVASATAFTVVKLAGAAYLVYMGVRLLMEHRRISDLGIVAAPVRSMRRVFADGVVVMILNPKVAVFFLAFLPQFVDPSRGDAQAQLLVLSALYLLIGLLSDGTYALLVGRFFRRSPVVWRRTNLVAGTTFIGLGVVAATSGGVARQS